MPIKAYIQRINIELLVWPTALLLLYFMDPHRHGEHSLCILKRIGLAFCPGCGLGHAISFLLHGQWSDSQKAHPLGPFAILVLGYRIVQLVRSQWQSFAELKTFIHE